MHCSQRPLFLKGQPSGFQRMVEAPAPTQNRNRSTEVSSSCGRGADPPHPRPRTPTALCSQAVPPALPQLWEASIIPQSAGQETCAQEEEQLPSGTWPVVACPWWPAQRPDQSICFPLREMLLSSSKGVLVAEHLGSDVLWEALNCQARSTEASRERDLYGDQSLHLRRCPCNC